MTALANRPIVKMNGIGNAIAVLDLRGLSHVVSAAEARAIHRVPGLGFDQLMVLHDPARAASAARIVIYNNDGSTSDACGNGTRCVAYLLMRGRDGDRLLLESDAGPLPVRREGELTFTVDMGAPRFGWRDIPLAHDVGDTSRVRLDPPVDGAPATFAAVSMGNPHAIFFVPDAAAIDLGAVGPKIEHHPLFPERANISFAAIAGRERIVLRVWERGAGATLACGSAACATLVAAARAGRTQRRARVALPGGELTLDWRSGDDHVLMTGPVEFEFETRLDPVIFTDAAA
ncbi:MAG: diaminopimelate epimerase [Methylobacteriaceae bacterium]|nr:diaminopimelate epimerase [Methylobacteriaceae bacterium]